MVLKKNKIINISNKRLFLIYVDWDGGRPQTIHLEIKGPEGTRKVSKKGRELKLSLLQAHVNFTAVLYASNIRGRSGVLRLAIPPPPTGNFSLVTLPHSLGFDVLGRHFCTKIDHFEIPCPVLKRLKT